MAALPESPPRALSPREGRASAQHRWLLFLDAAGEPLPLDRPDAPSLPPLLDSTGAPWADILCLQHHRLRPAEVSEHTTREHLLSLRPHDPAGPVGGHLAGECSLGEPVRPGDFDLKLAAAPCRARWDHAHEVLVLGLEPAFLQALADQVGQGGRPVEIVPRLPATDPVILHLVLALRAELRAGCPGGRLFGEGLATALAAHLLRHHAVRPQGRGPGHRGGLPPARLRRVLDHIEAQPGGDTGLRQLAGIAGLSPRHFAALFRRSTGLPPHRYVLRRRVERAKEMLTDPRLSLAEVGYALGFPSQAHFTTVFRKLVGATPGNYRKGQ